MFPELDPNAFAKGKATKEDARGRSKQRHFDIQSVQTKSVRRQNVRGMSTSKTPKLVGIPAYPPTQLKNRQDENNVHQEESLRSRDPRFNPDELDSQLKLKKSFLDESELSLEDQEDSPKLIKIPTISKKGKRVSPKKRRKSVDKSLSPVV